MHHKRKRPKNRRAGCLYCKAHKGNGIKGAFRSQTYQEQRALQADKELGLSSRPR